MGFKNIIAVLLLICGLSSNLYAQTVLLESEAFKADATQAIHLVYNMEYEASWEYLQKWVVAEPDHALWKLWEGFPYWWMILENLNDTSHDAQFISIMEEANWMADRMLHRSRSHKDALVIKTLANGYLSRLYANRGKWYQSFNHGRTALNVLNVLERNYPDLPDTQFGTGLYLYFTAFVTETNRVARAVSFMLPSGNREAGLDYLRTAAQESTLVRPEAVYFLGHILLNYENNTEEALIYLDELVQRYPQNIIYRRLWNRAIRK